MAHGELGELLERSGELEVIRAGAEAVAAGEGRAVVVEGPAGSGRPPSWRRPEPTHARSG